MSEAQAQAQGARPDHGEQARTVPPRYAFRLEDLRVFHLVRASCHACGHKAIIPNATLLGRLATHACWRSSASW